MSGYTEKVAAYRAVKAFTRIQVSHSLALRFSRLQDSENKCLLGYRDYDSFSISLSKQNVWGATPTVTNVLEAALGLGRC